ncbi:ARM repeat-containing protein [Cylindrobasidium torrendii FP15055 ss-10]|uniref:ARM repeat-containing protein n=1 Tax=Cylindrobasidium torrendii FP15055 ss-10 TaxID=1314674 RepID=A0A0D7BHT5_9AGAR|nr:ARM repeat-containing protein [Cylindrobasidium torrendii FP15055 ss-10]
MAASANKKRAAPTQASGSAAKKAHLDVVEKKQKRSQPVTRPALTSGSDSEDDEGVWEDVEEEEEAQAQAQDEMEVDGGEQKQAKDPQAVREAHRAQKVVQDQRKAAKPHSTLLADAKRVWSLARQKNLKPPERQKHIHELMGVIRGKVKDIVFKHDASRIVQTVVKHGKQKERDEIAVELKGKYKELAQNKYSKFLVSKLIKQCPAHRASILLEFQNSVLRLLLHREATGVMADAFELYANAYERSILLRDFYGKEANLFSLTSGSDEDKERAKKGLVGVLEGADTERRRRILDATREGIINIFNNSDKGAVTHAIVHRALWEYITAVNAIPEDDHREKAFREIFETCQEVLAELVHTRDGSRVVREFLAQGTAKDRKQILKVLKPHLSKMFTNEDAQLVVYTAIDVIDDTKLVLKTILPEIQSSLDELYPSPQGRRVLMYLLTPRTKRHFTPAQINTISETDSIRGKTSKKDAAAREAEIRTGVSEALLSWIAENADKVVRDPGGSLVVTEAMLYADGDKTAASAALVSAVAHTYPSTDAANPHLIDLAHSGRMYKTLLQGGHFNKTSRAVEKLPRWDGGAFAQAFIEAVGQDVFVGICTKGEKGGVFVAAEALRACPEAEKQKAVKWFTKDVLKDIKKGEFKGKGVLLEQLGC